MGLRAVGWVVARPRALTLALALLPLQDEERFPGDKLEQLLQELATLRWVGGWWVGATGPGGAGMSSRPTH